jgi:hypothetical protein
MEVVVDHLFCALQSSKFEVEKFNNKNNFELWNLKMQDLLVQQGNIKSSDG